ncbi:erythromycin resistance leader peptide [Gracilibacillus kekensis]
MTHYMRLRFPTLNQ